MITAMYHLAFFFGCHFSTSELQVKISLVVNSVQVKILLLLLLLPPPLLLMLVLMLLLLLQISIQEQAANESNECNSSSSMNVCMNCRLCKAWFCLPFAVNQVLHPAAAAPCQPFQPTPCITWLDSALAVTTLANAKIFLVCHME